MVSTWEDAARAIRLALRPGCDVRGIGRKGSTNGGGLGILVTGAPGSGKTRACLHAVRDGFPWVDGRVFNLTQWDLAAAPPTMVGNMGLERFFMRGGGGGSEAEAGCVLMVDDVDTALAVEGGPRSPGVMALVSILSDPSRSVVMTSTISDPFKVLGSSAACKAIRSAVRLRVCIENIPAPPPPLLPLPPTSGSRSRRSKEAVAGGGGAAQRYEDELSVLSLEAAAGYSGDDALTLVATDLRRILLR